MTKRAIRVSEAEAANDFASLLDRVRAGAEVVIERDAEAVAVIRPAAPYIRLLSESLRLAKERGSKATLDGDFGTGGLVHTELPPGNSAEALEMVIQPDGRIVVGGLACRDPAPGGGPACHYGVVARYLAE